MRVVHYVYNLMLGGIQKAPCVLAARMAEIGHDAFVFAGAPGPRYDPKGGLRLEHRLLRSNAAAAIVHEIQQVQPEVVHLHFGQYNEDILRAYSAMPAAQRPLIVSTPVFGRPPNDRSLLQQTKTCAVGIYTLYRLNKWLGLSIDESIRRGFGYVPLTPFQPPNTSLSATDPPEQVAERRRSLGIPDDLLVCGRIGRDDVTKWNPHNLELVDRLLTELPGTCWLSVGFPSAMGRDQLAAKWGNRFRNFTEITDFQKLATVISSLDVQIFASRYGECFASSICEAAGLSVPTIALSTPLRDNGQTEQVIEGQTGWLVGGIPDAIQLIKRIIVDKPRLLDPLKHAARDRAYARWHVNRATDDLLALYQAWRDNKTDTPYQKLMLQESVEFADQYRQRVFEAASRAGTVTSVKTQIGLRAVESWSTFVVGQKVRSLAGKILRR